MLFLPVAPLIILLISPLTVIDFSFKLFFWFINNLRLYDFVVVHGLWNIGSILALVLNKRYKIILTVHGFLDPYVLKKSWFKKKIYWFLFQKLPS